MEEIILEVKNIKKYFPVKAGLFKKTVDLLKAVDDISFNIRKREIFGLVGESGCGKTTVGLSILRLIEPTSGKIFLKNRELTQLNKKELRIMRQKMQMIFQDPFSSLNPRMTCFELISEPLMLFGKISKSERKDKVLSIMEKVGLLFDDIYKYPHEFSGGQKQKIGIARAIAVEPEFLVADEPVSSLDVSVRAQILKLIEELRKKLELSILFISHDLSVVRYICDRVAVMYLGKIVELSTVEELFDAPKHPYTQALLSAIPVPDPDYEGKRIILKGEPPTPINPPSGCNFHPRCDYALPKCSEVEPELIKIDTSKEHYLACHRLHIIERGESSLSRIPPG